MYDGIKKLMKGDLKMKLYRAMLDSERGLITVPASNESEAREIIKDELQEKMFGYDAWIKNGGMIKVVESK